MYVVWIYAKNEKDLKRLKTKWRSNFKARADEKIKNKVLVEKTLNKNILIVVTTADLLGLFIALKLLNIAKNHNVYAILNECKSIVDVDKHVDDKIHEQYERGKLRVEYLYEVKKALKTLKLPRGRLRKIIIDEMSRV